MLHASEKNVSLTVIQGNADLLTETILMMSNDYTLVTSWPGLMQYILSKLLIDIISRRRLSGQLHIESIIASVHADHLFGYMEFTMVTGQSEIRSQEDEYCFTSNAEIYRVLIERAIMNVISNGLDYLLQGGTGFYDVQQQRFQGNFQSQTRNDISF